MAPTKEKIPDFFGKNNLDPVEAAIGKTGNTGQKAQKNITVEEKKKAGFYLSVTMLERFNRKFHELKLAGVNIENKSVLLESALAFALDDIDKGSKSRILKHLS